MKKFLPTLLIACALVAPAALTASTFEGKVHMRLTTSGKKDAPQEMDFRIKEDLVRIEIQSQEKSGRGAAMGAVIMDAKKQEMTILMTESQMYMVRSLAVDATKQAAAHEGGADVAHDVLPVKTGEHEKILGYDCEKIIAKSAKSVTTLWVTGDLGNFMGLGAGAAGGFGGRRGASSAQAAGWEDFIKGKSMFPMRVVTANLDGQETNRMEVTAVEKQSIPDSDFVPPAGWRNVGDMMKGMMPGMMPGGR